VLQEALLLRRAQKGDSQAFEALVAPYEKRIYALCLRITCNREDALDAAQETMIRCWKGLPAYRGQARFGTWLYRIAVNTSVDMMRRRKPGVDSLEKLQEAGIEPSAGDGDPQTWTETRQRREKIAQGLAKLPEELRTALVLRDIQGFSYEEIAEILSSPLGTVKSRISRGREKLVSFLFQDQELFKISNVQENERGKTR